MRRIFLFIILALLTASAYAEECVVKGLDEFKDAVGQVKSGGCVTDKATYRDLYAEFFPGATEFQVIRWKESNELSINAITIEGAGDKPVVLIADPSATVKLSGGAIILKTDRIIVDHLTIENAGISLEGERGLVVRCRIISSDENGILVQGKDNRIADSEVASNGINGIVVSGLGTVVTGSNIHDNGKNVSGTSCAESSVSTCQSLILEAESCFDLLAQEPVCEEPGTILDDSCGNYWTAKKRCLDLWAKANVKKDASKEDAVTAVFDAYPGAQGGSGIVVDAPKAKILKSRVYNNKSKDIYINALPSSAISKGVNYDLDSLQTALVSETIVGDLFVSRFPLPSIAQLAATSGAEGISVSGNVGLSNETWYPWNKQTVNVTALRAEVFLQDGENSAFVGSAPIDSSGRFVVNVNRTIENPVFVAMLVDTERGNTSPLATGKSASPAGDDDNDGLPNEKEDLNGNGQVDAGETDPLNPDTDGDGLLDGEEKDRLNPLKPDSDGDCLPDGLELGISEEEAKALVARMPKRPHLEISAECQKVLSSHSVTVPTNAVVYDSSNLVTFDNVAMLFDADPLTVTDPTSADTDKDGMRDGDEDFNFNGKRDASEDKKWLETDPTLADSDNDGIIDGEEGDKDGDGKLGPNESDPHNDDTDGDGVKDGQEIRLGTYPNACDSDDDGLSDGVEAGAVRPASQGGACHGLEAAGTNYKNPHAMDPKNPDSDSDGLMDGTEDANGNGWIETGESDPSDPDTDHDGLNDGVEAKGDFDGDGTPDFDLRLIKAGPKCSPPPDIADVDCDKIPNAIDVDSDNDSCPDAQEGGSLDQNANGLPDVYDNEAKGCTQSGGGGGSFSIGGGPEKPKEGEELGATPAWLLDQTGGGACTLVERDTQNTSTNTLVIVVYLIVIAGFLVVKSLITCRENSPPL